MYTLLYLKWITTKDLLYSTGHSDQWHSGQWQPDGRGFEGRMDTWICMAESLHCSPETITVMLTGWTLIGNKKFKLF